MDHIRSVTITKGPWKGGTLVPVNARKPFYRVLLQNGHRATVLGIKLEKVPWFLVSWMTNAS